MSVYYIDEGWKGLSIIEAMSGEKVPSHLCNCKRIKRRQSYVEVWSLMEGYGYTRDFDIRREKKIVWYLKMTFSFYFVGYQHDIVCIIS